MKLPRDLAGADLAYAARLREIDITAQAALPGGVQEANQGGSLQGA
jgi:hypothetical protein